MADNEANDDMEICAEADESVNGGEREQIMEVHDEDGSIQQFPNEAIPNDNQLPQDSSASSNESTPENVLLTDLAVSSDTTTSLNSENSQQNNKQQGFEDISSPATLDDETMAQKGSANINTPSQQNSSFSSDTTPTERNLAPDSAECNVPMDQEDIPWVSTYSSELPLDLSQGSTPTVSTDSTREQRNLTQYSSASNEEGEYQSMPTVSTSSNELPLDLSQSSTPTRSSGSTQEQRNLTQDSSARNESGEHQSMPTESTGLSDTTQETENLSLDSDSSSNTSNGLPDSSESSQEMDVDELPPENAVNNQSGEHHNNASSNSSESTQKMGNPSQESAANNESAEHHSKSSVLSDLSESTQDIEMGDPSQETAANNESGEHHYTVPSDLSESTQEMGDQSQENAANNESEEHDTSSGYTTSSSDTTESEDSEDSDTSSSGSSSDTSESEDSDTSSTTSSENGSTNSCYSIEELKDPSRLGSGAAEQQDSANSNSPGQQDSLNDSNENGVYGNWPGLEEPIYVSSEGEEEMEDRVNVIVRHLSSESTLDDEDLNVIPDLDDLPEIAPLNLSSDSGDSNMLPDYRKEDNPGSQRYAEDILDYMLAERMREPVPRENDLSVSYCEDLLGPSMVNITPELEFLEHSLSSDAEQGESVSSSSLPTSTDNQQNLSSDAVQDESVLEGNSNVNTSTDEQQNSSNVFSDTQEDESTDDQQNQSSAAEQNGSIPNGSNVSISTKNTTTENTSQESDISTAHDDQESLNPDINDEMEINNVAAEERAPMQNGNMNGQPGAEGAYNMMQVAEHVYDNNGEPPVEAAENQVLVEAGPGPSTSHETDDRARQGVKRKRYSFREDVEEQQKHLESLLLKLKEELYDLTKVHLYAPKKLSQYNAILQYNSGIQIINSEVVEHAPTHQMPLSILITEQLVKNADASQINETSLVTVGNDRQAVRRNVFTFVSAEDENTEGPIYYGAEFHIKAGNTNGPELFVACDFPNAASRGRVRVVLSTIKNALSTFRINDPYPEVMSVLQQTPVPTFAPITLYNPQLGQYLCMESAETISTPFTTDNVVYGRVHINGIRELKAGLWTLQTQARK